MNRDRIFRFGMMVWQTYGLSKEELSTHRQIEKSIFNALSRGSAAPSCLRSAAFRDWRLSVCGTSAREGWQTRMNDALRTYLREHPLKAA